MASIMQGDFGSLSVPQQSKSPFTLDSTQSSQGSGLSSTGIMSSMATSLISSWSTYSSAKLAANSLESLNKISAADLVRSNKAGTKLQNIMNNRTAIQQGLKLYAFNERAQEARSVLVNNKIDSQVSAMQAAGQLAAQQAFLGQTGGSAERVSLQGEINSLRVQDTLVKEQDALNSKARSDAALLRIGAVDAMGYYTQVTAAPSTVEHPSGTLAALSAFSDVLKIGSQIKGG